MKMTLRNIILGLVAFIAVSVVAGQVLMFGQGDTPAISMRWGFFYVIGGCGIPVSPKMIRLGEFDTSVRGCGEHSPQSFP